MLSATEILHDCDASNNNHGIEDFALSYAENTPKIELSHFERKTFVSILCSDLKDEIYRQRLVNAALCVDWSCYSSDEDRVSYGRLNNVIGRFPSGFRVWFCQLGSGRIIPVGYTGWYPIEREIFSILHENPAAIKHRGEIRPTHLKGDENYIWLFNYSIIAQLRHSDQSRIMLQNYRHDIFKSKIAGLSAAILTAESEKVALRFMMTYRGDMTHDGIPEKVFTGKFADIL